VLPLLKDELLIEITRRSQVTGDIPTSKDVQRCTHAARRFFGSWNKAIVACGLTPNTQWIAKKRLKCKDGHPADSISEMLVDNWLHAEGISHVRHQKYPQGQYTCDFYLTDLNIWVEYFGLLGAHPQYDLTVETKRLIAVQHGLILVEFYPEHLYPEFRLARSLFESLGSKCSSGA
jgi:hypothetical protein